MSKQTLVIACDGPARAGKTSLVKTFETKLGIPGLRTGNIYRGIALLAINKLGVTTLSNVDDAVILEAILSHDLTKLTTNFSGQVYYDNEELQQLARPILSNSAYVVAHIEKVRTDIVEPLIIAMVEECEHSVIISEGREEGLVWSKAGYLGLTIFLSVDPLVAAIRERDMRKSMNYEDQLPLGQIMSQLMKYDLDNASRNSHPTYISEDPVIYTGTMNTAIKRAITNKTQIVVPTSSIDQSTVFKRVVSLVKAAGLLKNKQEPQIALL